MTEVSPFLHLPLNLKSYTVWKKSFSLHTSS
jgi:hypothetical protein